MVGNEFLEFFHAKNTLHPLLPLSRAMYVAICGHSPFISAAANRRLFQQPQKFAAVNLPFQKLRYFPSRVGVIWNFASKQLELDYTVQVLAHLFGNGH